MVNKNDQMAEIQKVIIVHEVPPSLSRNVEHYLFDSIHLIHITIMFNIKTGCVDLCVWGSYLCLCVIVSECDNWLVSIAEQAV